MLEKRWAVSCGKMAELNRKLAGGADPQSEEAMR